MARAPRDQKPRGSADHGRLKSMETAIRSEIEELDRLSRSTRGDRAPVELDQQSVGRLSRMDAMQQQSMDLAREERRRQRLAMLKAAIGRIEGGEYGYCLVCGGAIAYKRLEADPAATRCIDCLDNAS